ncbi:MAG: DDE domain-containing protein [Candidatus Electrothrix sp. AW1]|nr:DDE domain-containing protein [Candidatus Electrothrix sp. AX1]MCI5181113.1 DDE domain-containing protein [Candidatus Electrothrix gigas]
MITTTYLETSQHEGQLTVKTPQWNFQIADTKSNRKVLMVILRSLQHPVTERPLFTFKKIADAFGYPDRRNVNNYWRDFEQCGQDILSYIRRKRKVDKNVVQAVQSELAGNIQAKLPELCLKTNERLGRSDLTPENIQTALEQIPCTVIRREVIYRWESGTFHPKEKYILEEAMAALQQKSPQKKQCTLKLLSDLNIKADNSDEEDQCNNIQKEYAEELLDVNASVDEIPESVRMKVVAMTFYFWNVPLSRIGIWCGKSKSTIWNWITVLSCVLWPMIQDIISVRVKSSAVYIDEKWIKIKGRWHYWFVAVDVETGLPVIEHLLRSQTKWACRWFLVKMMQNRRCPNTIITDGLVGYSWAISSVFVNARHLLCLFHHQQGVTRWVKKHLIGFSKEQQVVIKDKMKKIIQTKDTRTAESRLERLEKKNLEKQWGLEAWLKMTRKNLKRLLPAMRKNKYPRTNNEIERFFRQFQRFYKTRNGFGSFASAGSQLVLFMVVFLFTCQAKSGKAPIENIMPEAKRMPFYHLINDPIRWMPDKQVKKLSRKAGKGYETGELAEIQFDKAA